MRQKTLRASLRAADLDGVLLTSGVSVRYYTGFTSDECYVLLTDDCCVLITDFRYTIQAREQVCGCAEVVEVNGHAKQLEALREQLARFCCKRCGFEEGALTVASFNELSAFPVEWRAFGKEVSAPRRIKSAEEIASLQKAQKMADTAYAQLLNEIAPGMSEHEVAAKLNYLCEMQGSEGPSFDPIVGSGPNGAMCHAIPGERLLQSGDLVVVDFGCVANGYHSDMTRTFGVGAVDDTLKKIYAITLEAQQRCLAALHAGMTGGEFDAIARAFIVSAGYGDHFGHGLGHGYGLEIHEPPRAGRGSDDPLLPGMTVTVEPGIYLEGRGGVRIEDCVVVTEQGCLNLVSSAKDLLFI